MPKVIRMPRNLGTTARGRFIDEIFSYYRAAGRPTLDTISGRIKARDDLAGTASRETIRRVLSEGAVPLSLTTVEAIFVILCELAGREPNEARWDDDGYNNDQKPGWEVLREAWDDAVEEAHEEPPPEPAVAQPQPRVVAEDSDDPWTSDEPPF